MSRQRLVVVGGDAAGMSAASKVRREDPQREIVVFERGPHTSYSACGIPYLVGGLLEDAEQLVARSPQEFRDKYAIDARVRHEVSRIDPHRQRVEGIDLESGRTFSEAYDQLLLATGARPFCPDLPGREAANIFGLSTLQSGIRVQQALERMQPRRAVVVGGGYIGLEMAEALVRRGLQVTLVQRGPEVMETLDPDMGALVSDALRRVGVTLYLGEAVTGFETAGGRAEAVVTEQRSLPTDLVILGLGAVPNADLGAAAGLATGLRGALKVDSRQQTGTSGIWAAGDCVETVHRVSGRPFYVSLGTVANKQGTVAGINLAGGHATFPGVVGTAVSKICQYEVARTGLLEREIAELGLEFTTATVKTRTRAGYYPGAGAIHVKLLAQKGSGRLLGGQIVGMEGAAKRIDVLATALTTGLTAQDLVDLDLSYAPPYSPVWDPVQTAARQLV